MTTTMNVQARVLAGRYQLGKQLSQGKMGSVYEGIQLLLNRKVAIKILNTEEADGLTLDRFEREAALLAKLDHQNLVTIYDYGRDGKDFFFVMEYVEGVTLAEYIEARGNLPFVEVVRIAREVARGLRAAHRQGVIHRDLKPENILIRTDTESDDRENVKVLDFGIAKLLEQPLPGEESRLFGSPRFMSPEQICGEAVGPESDIYALGVVMFTMIAGTPPFDATTYAEVLQLQVSEQPPPILSVGYRRNCPRALERVVRRCLEKFPSHRFSSVSALLPHLEALYTELPDAGRRPLPRSTTGRSHPVPSAATQLTPTHDVHPMTSDFPAYNAGLLNNARLAWILAGVCFTMSMISGLAYLLG